MTNVKKFREKFANFYSIMFIASGYNISLIFRINLQTFYLEHQKAVYFFPLTIGQTYFALSRNN